MAKRERGGGRGGVAERERTGGREREDGWKRGRERMGGKERERVEEREREDGWQREREREGGREGEKERVRMCDKECGFNIFASSVWPFKTMIWIHNDTLIWF